MGIQLRVPNCHCHSLPQTISTVSGDLWSGGLEVAGLFFCVGSTLLLVWDLENRNSLRLSPVNRLSQNTVNFQARTSHAWIVKYLTKLHSREIQFAFAKLKKYSHREQAAYWRRGDLYYRSLVAANEPCKNSSLKCLCGWLVNAKRALLQPYKPLA